MNRPTLSATLRTHRGRKTQDLRDAGSLPAIVYGLAEEPTSISVDRVAFVKLYNQVRHAGLLDLHIEGGKSFPVIIQDFAQHPVQDTVTHADFRIVDLKKAMDAVIALRFVGESKAVKALGGNLVVQLNELHVHAKPESLVPMIDVDMTPLETFDDVIYVTDVPLPDGVEVKEELRDRAVLSIAAPKQPEVEEEVPAEGTDEAAEGEEKKDGSEKGEGASDA